MQEELLDDNEIPTLSEEALKQEIAKQSKSTFIATLWLAGLGLLGLFNVLDRMDTHLWIGSFFFVITNVIFFAA